MPRIYKDSILLVKFQTELLPFGNLTRQPMRHSAIDIEGKYLWAATSTLGLVFPNPDLGEHGFSFFFQPPGYLIAVVDVVVAAGKRRQLQETVFCYRCNLAKHVLSGMEPNFMRFVGGLFPPGAKQFL
ncbi:hypothetical protein CEXT_640851 [Caerostris extrusa]|uniref:Uncharacterized protein n=1 Tax=Caerostris extrusa TaxID=172846 RepID=A0AAV4MUQ4_CAEEX|nr:hypothetical protein CEXT_640851 [Caerostris extrusa]